jgi:hypothetical protein
MSLLEYYSGQGIYVSWNWSGTAGAVTMAISRSDYGVSGTYTAVDVVDFPEWEYIDVSGYITSYYKFEEKDTLGAVVYTHPIVWGEETLVMASIAYELWGLQTLRIWRERLFMNRDRTNGRTEFINWNLTPAPVLEIGAKQDEENQGMQQLSQTAYITETSEETALDYPDGLKYTVDYNGNVYFWDSGDTPEPIQSYDDVWASYQFKAFTNHEINDAMNQALYGILAQPGVNKGYQNIGQVPVYWGRGIVAGAAAFLLRRLQVKLFNPTLVIPFTTDQRGPEPVTETRNTLLERLSQKSKEYLEEYKEYQKSIPISKYPDIGIITTPEYVLPGGRSRYFSASFKGV